MKTEEQKQKWNTYMRKWNKDNREKNKQKESDRQKRNYLKSLSGYFYLYYLPEEHYVGITNNVYRRMNYHRSSGKHVEDVEIVAKFKRQVNAHLYETMLHSFGYEGFFVGNYKEIKYED